MTKETKSLKEAIMASVEVSALSSCVIVRPFAGLILYLFDYFHDSRCSCCDVVAWRRERRSWPPYRRRWRRRLTVRTYCAINCTPAENSPHLLNAMFVDEIVKALDEFGKKNEMEKKKLQVSFVC